MTDYNKNSFSLFSCLLIFFFSSRRRHTRLQGDWSSDVCSSDLQIIRWIPFDQFENVEYFSEGGFSKVYKATWKNGRIKSWDEKEKRFVYWESWTVILKCLENSDKIGTGFLKEVGNLINYFKFISIHVIDHFYYDYYRCHRQRII